MSQPLIALCGYAYSGKDTAALGLVERGWTRVAFADALKQVAKELGWNGEKDDHGRWMLQQLGQSVREHIDPLAWVQAAAKTVTEIGGPVVITDCRYRNEADWVRSAGGRIVRVTRPDVGPVNDHISENDLDDYPMDGFLLNHASPERLGNRLAIMAAEWWG